MSDKEDLAASVDLYEYNPRDAGVNNVQWEPITVQSNPTNDVDSIHLVTWNIWFDELHRDLRYKSLLQELRSLTSVDIVAFQEVTKPFLSILRADQDIQKTWVVTDPWDHGHQRNIQDIWYRNMFLVRKTWAGYTKASVQCLPSVLKRFIVILEISGQDRSVIRIGNAHFDSMKNHVVVRKIQGKAVAKILQRDIDESPLSLSILCGDLNFTSSDELANLTKRSDDLPTPYRDCIAGFSNSAVESLESASFGATFPHKIEKPHRSDFVLYTGDGWTCTQHKYVGNTPIIDSNSKKVECESGTDGNLYPSDHLGIFVELTRATS